MLFLKKNTFIALKNAKYWMNMKGSIVFSNITYEFAAKNQMFILRSIPCKTLVVITEFAKTVFLFQNPLFSSSQETLKSGLIWKDLISSQKHISCIGNNQNTMNMKGNIVSSNCT